MTTNKKIKSFDCIAWKHQQQAEIYADIKDMTREQEIHYFEQGALQGPLGHWWSRVKSSSRSKRSRRE